MIIPVILAGGSGTRLWPASRKSYPKQFTELVGSESLFQATLKRLSDFPFTAPTIVTGNEFRFITAEQVDDAGIEGATILLEPAPRNTAPAILAAALMNEKSPEAIMLVCPSDHLIADQDAFVQAVLNGRNVAASGELVTFGVAPSSPETGYGYLELTTMPEFGAPQALSSFVEKPDAETAKAFVDGGCHLWNAGIFMFRVDAILDAFNTHAPELVMLVRAAIAQGQNDLCFFRLGQQAYENCDDISIDVAVMEKAEGLVAIPVDCEWNDLGSWKSLHQTAEQDADGNAVLGNTLQVDCKNTMLSSNCEDTKLVGLGLENIAAIATDDAILVASLDDSERVKDVVAALKAQDAPQATDFRRCHRPWGYYETLSLGERYQVKRIMVQPGAALSLQSHVHRAEHWVVVEGSAHVTVGEEVSLLTENQSIYIPLGAVHRLENQGKVPLNLIEVQSGSYLGEDDIIRYEDLYDRTDKTQAA